MGLRGGVDAKYYVEARFDAPDTPPAITWLATLGNSNFQDAVARYLEGMRLPCQNNGPVTFRGMYEFRMEGDSYTLLKDMSLRDFLGAATDLKGPIFFELSSMDCPFDLRIEYLRPYSKNIVSELEKTNPNRQLLIDWLSTLTLNLGKENGIKVLGNQFNLTVPCGKVDL
ncbi:MAG TPA: hypothetical protein VNW52_13125, partial [Burkholderiaceae bacterium]|nr:hypothetical protein [Burkholderiaceae bacterium]